MKPLLMVVDDEFLVRMDLVDMAHGTGFDTVEAGSAAHAVDFENLHIRTISQEWHAIPSIPVRRPPARSLDFQPVPRPSGSVSGIPSFRDDTLELGFLTRSEQPFRAREIPREL